MHKFGVIYLGSRTECRREFLPALDSNENVFTTIDEFLASEQNAIRVMNFGVHVWIHRMNLRVDYPSKLVPPNAISSIALHHVAVRPQDFDGDSVRMLEATTAQWDLHDFTHHTVSGSSPILYGNKYFETLVKLPPRLTALIRSPGMNTAHPKPRCSDGLIFAQLLTPLFTEEIEALTSGGKVHTYSSLMESMADSLAAYLMRECTLRHGATGVKIEMEALITAEQLAVLVQNKFCELTASEVEQKVMTRGGPAGDKRDELDALSSADRIRHLVASRTWMYFEVRNTVKHRAHKLAYEKVTRRMLAKSDEELSLRDRELLKVTMKSMSYEGWESDQVPNLWQVLLDDGERD